MSTKDSTNSTLRTCIGCRQCQEVAGLVRIVSGPDGSLQVAKQSIGRGAWLCKASSSCFAKARRTRAFGRAFGRGVEEPALAALATALGLGNDLSTGVRG